MTDRVATTAGLFPRPEGTSVERAREAAVDAQREAGLDRFVEGQSGWTDLSHVLVSHEAVETTAEGLRIDGDLAFDGTLAAEHEAAAGLLADDESLHAIVPGPYTLAQYTEGGADTLDAVAAFLAEEVAALPEHRTLSVLDPALVADPPGDGVDARASEAVDAIAGATDASVALQTWGGAHEEKLYAHLMDADVDAFGFDFVAGDRDTHLYNVTEFGTKGDLSLGLVDGRSADIEDPDTVAERIEWVLGRIPSQTFGTVYATPNTGLASLSPAVAREKLSVLAAAVSSADT